MLPATYQTMCNAVDSGDRLHIIKGGQVGIVKGGAMVATLHTGDLLGEMSFILGWPRTARAVANGEVELLTIEKKEFLKFCNRHAITGLKVVLGLLKVICYRLQAYEIGLAAAPDAPAAVLLRYEPDHGLTWNEVGELLSAEEAAALQRVTREASYAAGAEVFAQRATDGALYAIRAGEIGIWYEQGGRKAQVARLGEGYVFGEVGFVLGWPRTATVVACTPATVTVIDKNLNRLRQLDDIYGGLITTLASNHWTVTESLKQADLVIGAVLIPGAAAPKLVRREMIAQMKRGSVVVDVAIDQGGCFETSHATTHTDPVYYVDNVLHYCVSNMPAAVPHTSTYWLNNATLPFLMQLATKGVHRAISESAALRLGVNTYKGKCTYPAVAEGQGIACTAVESLL